MCVGLFIEAIRHSVILHVRNGNKGISKDTNIQILQRNDDVVVVIRRFFTNNHKHKVIIGYQIKSCRV